MRTKIAILLALAVSASLFASIGYTDPARQGMLVNTCVACHGPNGNSVGPAIPNLGGASENYFIAAMLAYKFDTVEAIEEVVDADESLEDVEVLTRYSTIMGRIAKGYTVDEIKMMASYFSAQTAHRPTQDYDAAKAAKGKKVHKAHCEKCHEDEGRSAEDDSGVLAGQWKPYLAYTLHDYHVGAREMPKKMKKELKEVHEVLGEDGIHDLIHYYASIKD